MHHGEEAKDSESPAANGDLAFEEDETQGRRGRRSRDKEPATALEEPTSQSVPELPGDPPPHCPGRLGGATRVRLDPGNGNVVMATDMLKEATDVLNDGLITSSFDRVVPEEAHTVPAVCDQIETSANGRGGGPIRGKSSL